MISCTAAKRFNKKGTASFGGKAMRIFGRLCTYCGSARHWRQRRWWGRLPQKKLKKMMINLDLHQKNVQHKCHSTKKWVAAGISQVEKAMTTKRGRKNSNSDIKEGNVEVQSNVEKNNPGHLHKSVITILA